VRLSLQILVQRIEISWNARYLFLSKELGASRDSVVIHPQLLHYNIDDGFLPMINFLRSIGMQNSDFLKVLTSLTQVNMLTFVSTLKSSPHLCLTWFCCSLYKLDWFFFFYGYALFVFCVLKFFLKKLNFFLFFCLL
jgi:hypothetical protein